MCDTGGLDAMLVAVGVSIAVALVAIGIAAALNAGFFSAPGAPVPMIVAGVASAAAAVSLGVIATLATDYFECMGAPEECLGEFNNFMNITQGLMTVLGIQAAASFAAAGVAWIPWAGLAPMAVIAAALIVQAVLIPFAILFWADLQECLENAAAAPTVSTVVIVTAVTALGVALIFNAYRLKKPAETK